jgi:hypothetical protein
MREHDGGRSLKQGWRFDDRAAEQRIFTRKRLIRFRPKPVGGLLRETNL